MKRNILALVVILLVVLVGSAQQGYAQADGRTASTPAQYAELEKEILGLYRGGIYSERASWWDAQNFPMPRPVFPGEALEAGAQGAVVLSFYRYRGKAALIKVVESPHPALTRAAIEAVKQWAWLPFDVAGKPYPILTKLTVNFSIVGGQGRVDDPEDSPALRDLKHLQELRKKAVWPEEATTPQR